MRKAFCAPEQGMIGFLIPGFDLSEEFQVLEAK
jgi:hypothetical protein